MTAEKTWLERYVDERMCEHEESIGLRELNKVGREAGQLRDHKVVELSIGSPRSRSVETEPMTKSTSLQVPTSLAELADRQAVPLSSITCKPAFFLSYRMDPRS